MSTMSPGARRRSAKITSDIPRSVNSAMTTRRRRYVFIERSAASCGGGSTLPRVRSAPPKRQLLVQPHLLQAREVVDRLVRDEVLDVRPDREVVEPPVQERPRRIRFELLLDRLHLGQPFLRIQLLGLLVDLGHHLLVAVEAVVPG